MQKLILAFVFLCLSLNTGFTQISFTESAEFDDANKRFLISNSSNILARDLDGNYTVFGSTAASHGMEVLGNTLFALEGKVIKGIDLTTEAVVMQLTISEAVFLNGIANDGNSKIWVTDFNTKKIFEIDVSDLSNPTYTTLIANTQRTPNGIFYEQSNNRLLYVTWGANASILAVDLTDNSISTVFPTNFSNFDGIAQDSAGRYYISSWSPNQILVFEEDFSSPMTLITPALSSPADIGIAKEEGVLAIPMGSNIIFVDIYEEEEDTSTTSPIIPIPELGIKFGVQGNPVSDLSKVFLELESVTEVKINLIDLQGRRIFPLLNRRQYPGEYWISLAGINPPAGIYFVELLVGEKRVVEQIVFE